MPKSADAFRTISEVADWLGVQTHVLRFWESKFTQIKPVKRAGGRRYYRPADMLLLGGIRKLLHDDGLTIKGVQKILREEGMAHVADMSGPLDDETAAQLDADLITESGFVEAELAPSSAAEDTVTPFPPVKPTPAPVPEQAAPSDVPETVEDEAAVVPAPEPEPHFVPEPELEPAAVFDAIPDVDPEPEAAPVELPEPVVAPIAPAPIVPDPVVLQEPEAAPPAPDAALDTPEPVAAEADAPVEDGPVEDAPVDDAPVEDVPSFVSSFSHAPEEADREPPAPTPLPSFLTEALTDAPEASPELKPRIVDVPADPDTATLPASPSALSRLAKVRSLTPDQRSALRPLLAQLTALRDHMANTRRDPR